MKTLRNASRMAIIVLCMGVSGQLFAGNPIGVCQSGQAYLWGNSGTDIIYTLDRDIFPSTPEGERMAGLVRKAFDAWQDVPTSSLSYVQSAFPLDINVDNTNFAPFFLSSEPDGFSAVVYDNDGGIFELLFGQGSGILGFAGPEFVDIKTCTIAEGLMFLNGPALTNETEALDVLVHEIGHFSGFGHTAVNGQLLLGDVSSPLPVLFPIPFPPTIANGQAYVETMYPFYFGSATGSSTLHADDIAIASTLYPGGDFTRNSGEITGTIVFGKNKKTGVNVIARNINDPFFDAVSSISGSFAHPTEDQSNSAGVYRLTGLTPGAQYVVYIDQIVRGTFSIPPAQLSGPEEFYNGPRESGNAMLDNPQDYVPIKALAGMAIKNIDILFNIPPPLRAIPLGGRNASSVEIPLPFDFCLAGKAYQSVFINANGFLTFGADDTSQHSHVATEYIFLSGPPRIAGLWTFLAPHRGGRIYYLSTKSLFLVKWEEVPDMMAFTGGEKTFSIGLFRNPANCENGANIFPSDFFIHYGYMSPLNNVAITGYSSGGLTTSGFEKPIDLSVQAPNWKAIPLNKDAAMFEYFWGELGLSNTTLLFSHAGKAYPDRFEPNNSFAQAKTITLPFNSINTAEYFTGIFPAANDIDFYKFNAKAGDELRADVLTGQIDSVMGLWYCGNGSEAKCDDKARFIAAHDDKENNDPLYPLLSQLTLTLKESGTYALAVTFCCDVDFDGKDPGQGLPFDEGRYVLSVETR